MEITIDHLLKITNTKKLSLVQELVGPLNDCLSRYQINTELRVCHFLAQILHESGSFVYFKELASGSAYEGREDLGNTEKGDGVRFKGRGLIQITGRSNYKKLSEDLGQDFISHPELLENHQWGVISAGWFWDKKHLNQFADLDDLTTITKRINGGLNGLSDRKQYLIKAKSVLLTPQTDGKRDEQV